jgi:hypothetical protein
VNWRREPLVHFLVLSAAVFAAYRLRGAGEAAGAGGGRTIVVTGAEIAALEAAFSRTWLRAPNAEERERLIAEHVRTEVLAREATALGLDRDDSVIRRHLRMRMESLAEDVVRREPAESELHAFLAEHAGKFREEPRYSFRQVYLNPDRRGPAIEEDARRLLAELRGTDANPASSGDASLLAPEFTGAPRRDVAWTFGEDFAARLSALEPGTWQGPLASGYGLHLVLLRERTEGRMPALEEVREAVAREWSVAQVEAGKEELYARMRARYAVTIESARALGLAGGGAAGAARTDR